MKRIIRFIFKPFIEEKVADIVEALPPQPEKRPPPTDGTTITQKDSPPEARDKD